MAEKTSYGTIFKTTFLFGFVQVFKAVISIVKNKIAAILIGPEGIGLIGIFSSTIEVIRTGAGLGVSQSAVRDVAEAYESGDVSRYSKIIIVTNKIVLITGAFGCLLTLILSKNISCWTLGNDTYIISYCVLAVVIGLNIINDGKAALLKGTRQLRFLAYSSILGSIISITVALPLYYFYGKDGIVPEFLAGAALGLLCTQYFTKQLSFDNHRLPLREIMSNARPMIRMGCALMYVALLQFVVTLVLNNFVRIQGGLSEVGFFNVGTTILNAYFGLVVTAISTDYYPRISAINYDNDKVQDELNRQSIVSVVLVGPLFVFFLAFLPVWIRLLYSSEFLPSMDYIQFAIYWSLITVCSNQVDMILVAKFQTKAMAIIATIMRLLQLLLAIPLYYYWGLSGLGVTFAILGVFHLIVMSAVVYKLYKIHFNKTFVKIGTIVFLFAICSSCISEFQNVIVRYSLGALLVVVSSLFSYYVMKKHMKLNIFRYIKNLRK